jgi:hypothetical protein
MESEEVKPTIDLCETDKKEQSAAGPSQTAEQEETVAEKKLPPLSTREFRAYNSLAEKMDYYVCLSTTSAYGMKDLH